MAKLPVKILVAVALLSACTRPSPVSNALEVDLVPQLIAWSKVGGEFDLAKALPEGAYDRVCIVNGYNCLDSQKNLGRVDEYHSTFGMCVPENNQALVLVGNQKAHAALVNGAQLEFYVPSFDGNCVTASRAILRSNLQPDLKAQSVELLEQE